MTASIMDVNRAAGSISSGDGRTGQSKGSIDSSKHGEGTFAKTFTEVNGQMTKDKTVTFADGTTSSVERAITRNADGSKTIVKTDADGNVSTIQSSKVKNADGSFSISKQITGADGMTTSITGTETKANGETDRTMTRTNADGASETLSHQAIRNGQVVTHTTSGTNFDGRAVDRTSTWTTYA